MDKEILDDILKTYESIINIREHLPGMKVEDVWSDNAMEMVKKEYQYLLTLK